MSSLAEQLGSKRSEIEVRDLRVDGRMEWLRAVQRFIHNKPLGAFGALLVLVFALAAIFADQIAPYPYDDCKGCPRMASPSPQYVLGTDNLSRDMFSRIIFGARISVSVGFGAVLVGIGLATLLGVFSGYIGGWFDLLDLEMARGLHRATLHTNVIPNPNPTPLLTRADNPRQPRHAKTIFRKPGLD